MSAERFYRLGILGDERARKSLSPRMHGHVLAKHGLQGAYVALPTPPELVGQAVAEARAMDGLNVTVPHKAAVIEFLDELAPLAQAIGAVNTIINQGGRLIGDNTDAGGFLDALAHGGFNPAGKTALVLGAGGASRALLWALKSAGCARVLLSARRDQAAQALAADFGAQALAWAAIEDACPAAELLVNATAASSPAEAPELARRILALPLPAGGLTLDINYGRADNFWKAAALARDRAFSDGLAMLALQARRSFYLWTGLDIPAGDYFEALEDYHA